MRILQVCSAREIGGGEKHLADLSNSLARRGHDLFAALIPGSPLVPELPTVPPENIIELVMRNALSLGSAVKLARFARANKVDLIHAHVAREYPLAALAAGRANVPLVLTRHVLFPLSKVHRLTLRRTARVIAVSQAVADSLRAQNIFAPEKVVVIHNGIDLERFAQGVNPGRAEKSGFLVGMIGHLAPIKGPEDFIRAAAIVCERRDDVSFVIAGEDKSRTGENRAALERLIGDLKLNEKVRLIGWVEDVASLLSNFDLYVSPARSEPFGLSIVEAMAAGVPVLATTSEGAREILEDRQTGILVPIGDFEALANSICDLLSHAEQRQSLAANAKRVVRESFSLERMVMNTEQLYNEILRR
jgi:glycosyltransferase involved in cell wall biosynthesis